MSFLINYLLPMIGRFFRKNWPIIVLICVAIITHLQWFNPSSVLTSGDWQFRHPELLRGFQGNWSTWLSHEDAGQANVQLSAFPVRGFLWNQLANLGFNYDLIVKLTLLIFIAIGGFLSPYYLILRSFNDRLIAVVSSMIYGSCIYFLIIQTRHLFIAFAFAMAPLILEQFKRVIFSKSFADWVKFLLLFTIIIIYEIRMAYIMSFALILYFSVYRYTRIRMFVRSIVKTLLIIIILNSFWLIPI